MLPTVEYLRVSGHPAGVMLPTIDYLRGSGHPPRQLHPTNDYHSAVSSTPLTRSSFHADDDFELLKEARRKALDAQKNVNKKRI